MQLSARILTALAVLAFVVGVAVGTKGATDDVSAATGTIDALNVGVCATNNADVFAIGNCSQPNAFYLQVELDDLIEVDTLYATYAHDPKTAAEAPRAILQDGDLIRVSITDKDRDRRDPVLITSAESVFDRQVGGPFDVDTGDNKILRVTAAGIDNPPDPPAFSAPEIVADVVFDDETKYPDLPNLEQAVEFDEGTGDTTFGNSGTYEVLFERVTAGTGDFKPIARDGVVKFFGRVNPGDAAVLGPFGDLGGYITLDEDVVSGETNTPPAMVIQVSVPDSVDGNAAVQLQLIYYETSGIDYLQGGVPCFDDPDDDELKNNLEATMQASCTNAERNNTFGLNSNDTTDDDFDNDSFVLYAESDEDAGDGSNGDGRKNLALVETGRFTGTFQGFLRLTDADGPGGGENWGLTKVAGNLLDKLEDGVDADELMASMAVIGVGDGPVTVTYKDTNGSNREFTILIDIQPPTISIDSPPHKSKSDDEKPSFLGTFADNDSGLAADSFQLNVDNSDDVSPEDPIVNIDSGVDGPEDSDDPDGPGKQVLRRLDYNGYDTAADSAFGVITTETYLAQIYRDVHDPDDAAANYHTVAADDFDDGSPDGQFRDEVEIDFDEYKDPKLFAGFNNTQLTSKPRFATWPVTSASRTAMSQSRGSLTPWKKKNLLTGQTAVRSTTF